LVCAGIDALYMAIQEHLATKSTLPTVSQFRHDVFNYMFNRKGKMDDGRHIFLEKEDFSRCTMPIETWEN
jgi:hypothetical protein